MSVNIYDSSTETLTQVPGTSTAAFSGATSSSAGTKGNVPAPAAGDQDKYLKGDGTWKDLSEDSTIQTLEDNDDAMLNVLGAKNLLPNTAKSVTTGGITYAVNSDGSITASGTANAWSGLNICEELDIHGDYILSGCPSGGSSSTYELQIVTQDGSTVIAHDYGEGARVSGDYSNVMVKAVIRNGQSAPNDPFYPMLRLASIEDDTYAPYSRTNQELAGEVEPMLNLLGAKNLCPNTATTQTLGGVTFTVRGDGTIRAVGTATSVLLFDVAVRPLLSDRKYILSGCPQGGSGDTYYLHYTSAQDTSFQDYGEGVEFIPFDYTQYPNARVRLCIKPAAGEVDLLFKPMIRPASIKDDTYIPYAATNRQLTNSLMNVFPNITPSETTWIDAYGGKMSAEIDLVARYPNMKRIIGACTSGSNSLTTYPYMILVTAPTKIRIWALNNNFTSIQAFITFSTI